MAKAKTYPIIVDREVRVELKKKPARTFPRGWKGLVNKAEFDVIKKLGAGRLDEGATAQPDESAATESKAKIEAADVEIKSKHDAADAEIKVKQDVAAAKIEKGLSDAVQMLAAAKAESAQMIADAKKTVEEINAAAKPGN